MMLLRVDKILNLSSTVAIFLIALLTDALWTCHRHKNTLVLGQMLLQMQA